MDPKSFFFACNRGLVLALVSVPPGMSVCQSNCCSLIDGVNNCHCCVPEWKVCFEDFFLTFALSQPLFSSSPCEGTHLYCVASHKLEWHCKMFCSRIEMWQGYLCRQFACTGQIKRQIISRAGFKGNLGMAGMLCPALSDGEEERGS